MLLPSILHKFSLMRWSFFAKCNNTKKSETKRKLFYNVIKVLTTAYPKKGLLYTIYASHISLSHEFLIKPGKTF